MKRKLVVALSMLLAVCLLLFVVAACGEKPNHDGADDGGYVDGAGDESGSGSGDGAGDGSGSGSGDEGHTCSFVQQVVEQEYLASIATCAQKATYYFSCTCGKKGETTFSHGELSTEHAYGSWVSTGDGKHARTCANDSQHVENGDCAGGTATCKEKAVCDVCNTAYGELSTKHDYVNGTCKDCGDTIVNEGLSFALVNDGYEVSIGTCTDKVIFIPSVHQNKPVVSVAEQGFGQKSFIEEVYIPDSVKKIGAYAFYDCDAMTKVVIGNGVKEICNNAFYHNEGLIDVTLGSGVEKIDTWGFYYCTSLQYIRIPENLKTLGTQVFERCYNLVEVENHSKHFSVERRTTANGHIGRYAINISNPGETFTHKVAKEGDFYVVNLENEKVVFDYVGSETHWTFPADATSIHDGAFLQREDVIGVTFGNKLKSIGDSAFEQCKNLTSVIIPDSVEKIESSAFNSSGLCTAVVGNGLTALPYQAFSGCSQLVSIVIGKNVQTIKQNAFNQTEKLVEVINYSSHLTIEKGASTNHYLGYYAVSVYNGQAPYESKVTLDANGFYVLTHGAEKHLANYIGTATAITIPEGVTHIHQNALRIKGITSVTFASTVQHVGAWAFSSCASLSSVTLNEGLLTLGNFAFTGCTAIKNVTLPKTLNKIGQKAFGGCTALEQVIFLQTAGWYQTSSSDYTGGNAYTSTTDPSLCAFGMKANNVTNYFYRVA